MQMFSSTYHDYSNPFPNFPSSSSSSYPTTLPFLIDPENDFSNTLLNDPLSLPFIPSTTTTTTINHDSLPFHVQIQNEENVTNLADCTAMFEQDHGSNGYASAVAVAAATANYVGNSNGIIPNYLTQKPTIAKKDRHSKIHTSQGLRDRRVRLSSEIARKFFDLQDMLEFDKPSNTLEWLFTKSENAIKELARSKNNNSAYTEKDEVVDSNNNKSLTTTTTYGGNGSGDGSKGRKLKWTQRGEDGFCVQTKKESRERARARARERTCYKRVQDFEENSRCPATTNTQMLQQMMSSPIQNVQPYPPPSHLLLDSETQRDHHGYNVIEESIMIKRNMLSSLTHQNLASFNNNVDNNNDYPLLPYSTPNWDPNGFSNFCGIATMNLSTCFMNQWY